MTLPEGPHEPTLEAFNRVAADNERKSKITWRLGIATSVLTIISAVLMSLLWVQQASEAGRAANRWETDAFVRRVADVADDRIRVADTGVARADHVRDLGVQVQALRTDIDRRLQDNSRKLEQVSTKVAELIGELRAMRGSTGGRGAAANHPALLEPAFDRGSPTREDAVASLPTGSGETPGPNQELGETPHDSRPKRPDAR